MGDYKSASVFEWQSKISIQGSDQVDTVSGPVLWQELGNRSGT